MSKERVFSKAVSLISRQFQMTVRSLEVKLPEIFLNAKFFVQKWLEKKVEGFLDFFSFLPRFSVRKGGREEEKEGKN